MMINLGDRAVYPWPKKKRLRYFLYKLISKDQSTHLQVKNFQTKLTLSEFTLVRALQSYWEGT